jgi:hypothetical protein
MSYTDPAARMNNDAIIAFVLSCLIGLYVFGALASAIIFAVGAVAP